MSEDYPLEPTLSRASCSYVSSDATPESSYSCNQCAINTLKITRLEKELSTLQTAYKHKCIEFDEMTEHYDNVIDQKCRELGELQDGLNAILFNTRRQKTNSISTSSLLRNGSLTLNNIQSNNLAFLHRYQPSITPEPSSTITESPTSNINCRNKAKIFSKQTHINSNEVSYHDQTVNTLMSKYHTGILSEIQSDNDTQHDVYNCLSVHRIYEYLRQYKDDTIQFEVVYRDNITDILNDYHHIVMDHGDEYNEIYSLLPHHLKCNISKCKQFEEDKQHVIGDIMDNIHIYLCHSYDIGYRLMNNKWLKANELSARHDLICKIRGTECCRFQTNDDSYISMYYYWNEYKEHELYIEAKAKDLKHEMVDYYLNIEEYHCVHRKAKELIKTVIAKETVVGFDKYGLHCDDALQLSNIMVVYMYCRYNKLCFSFCSTFRRITKNESILSMKKRNTKYYWMSRILRESVECYGDKMGDTPIKKYYHGSTHLIFDLFVVKLFAPISSSTSIDVATIFCGNDGIIVEFTQYCPHLTYFNCSWISPFAAEEERLFFGGNDIIINAIRSFDCFLRASELRCDYDKDEIIIAALIDEYLHIQMNQFPQYINNVFAMFCKRRKEIYINIDDMYQYYDSFVSIFWTDIDNLLRLDKMVKLFPNAIKITIIYNDEYNDIDAQYLYSLLLILQSIHQMDRLSISLHSIFIKNIKYYDKVLIKRVQFKAKLHKIGWKLHIQQDECQHWSFLRIKQEDSVIGRLTKLQLV